MRIELHLLENENNEGTDSPYWLILDPRQNLSNNIDILASQITGPFFSRFDAEKFLNKTRYNFTSRAKVYCMSGYNSREYKDAYRIASKEKTDAIKKVEKILEGDE